MADAYPELLSRLWAALGGADELTQRVKAPPAECILPSVFAVDALAAATVAAASLAIAEFSAARGETSIPEVTVSRRRASASFVGEMLFAPDGWARPPVWDPIAGDYPAADGWIRLHTNYSYHRGAVSRVLGELPERSEVAAAVAKWRAADLETAVVEAGGCAAAMHPREEWLRSVPGRIAAAQPVVSRRAHQLDKPAGFGSPRPGRPLSGIRVLDLTRVIAGPVATQFLAAYGADVLRIDPPRFQEVGALLPITTAGKRCAWLDLSDPQDRRVFEALLADADVVVTGLRAGALTGLGYDSDGLRRCNPDVVTASLDAYGWEGPWAARRGFDSLVQMSSGIADAGRTAAGQDRPKPLPAQALDHGTGYLLAAAICRSLTERMTVQTSADVRCSLIATANLLCEYPTPGGLEGKGATWSAADTQPVRTAWGLARHVPVPGDLEGIPAALDVEAGPLGRHQPSWA
ncbi:MAG TPA: CoA transferase [Frankiaceae bacterium]|nr:CoA transferase [Frankiaceae bacterium]